MKNKILFAFLSLFFTVSSSVASSGAHLDEANVDVSDQKSLQRGANMYVNNCISCHALGFMRYNRVAEGLGLSEAEVMDTLMPSYAKIGGHMKSAMSTEDALEWFGTAPPDLSLISRSRGVDWLYTYLRSFYKDDSRPFGVNNSLFADVAMPNVLWELQGTQIAIYKGEGHARTIDRLELETPGSMTVAEYDAAILDLVNFLSYVGEPVQLERRELGKKVLLFLAFFFVIVYLLKKEYWKDIH